MAAISWRLTSSQKHPLEFLIMFSPGSQQRSAVSEQQSQPKPTVAALTADLGGSGAQVHTTRHKPDAFQDVCRQVVKRQLRVDMVYM